MMCHYFLSFNMEMKCVRHWQPQHWRKLVGLQHS
uniref:Uncharacterized protein n=1 Tax=Anguilla anguilla TaxID=7936 RepID=A0A0E9QQU1_ANGAN